MSAPELPLRDACAPLMLDFSTRFLYRLTLAVDANFRLKLKARNIAQEAPLIDGLAYRVHQGRYGDHLERGKGRMPEVNKCKSILHAIDQASTRGNKGLIAMGIGGVSCARHCFNQACGFADLEKGER